MRKNNISIQIKCPACGESTSNSGRPFANEWALACHMAGLISNGDTLHKAWALKYAPEADRTRWGWGLASELKLPIRKALSIQELQQLPFFIPKSLSVIDQLTQIELQLHSYIERRLEENYGYENENWWVEGIPLDIRQECAKRREEDRSRGDLFSYTLLIDLKKILDKDWTLFEPDFTRIRSIIGSKKEFLDQLTTLNEIRNRHFHPIRAPEPESTAYREDLDYVSRFTRTISEFSGCS